MVYVVTTHRCSRLGPVGSINRVRSVMHSSCCASFQKFGHFSWVIRIDGSSAPARDGSPVAFSVAVLFYGSVFLNILHASLAFYLRPCSNETVYACHCIWSIYRSPVSPISSTKYFSSVSTERPYSPVCFVTFHGCCAAALKPGKWLA